MAITINGSSAAGNIDLGTNGTITDLAVGGVPDGTIDRDALANAAINNNKLATSCVNIENLSATGTPGAANFLCGNNTWAAAGGGITRTDHWRITTAFSGSTDPISSNWENVPDDLVFSGRIGAAFSAPSSGIWTFPETGIWDVTLTLTYRIDDAESRSAIGLIKGTQNNGTDWADRSGSRTSMFQAGNWAYGSTVSRCIVDVTDTAQVKVRFASEFINQSTQVMGDSGQNLSSATFIRLGDT